jgi:predicted permease
VSMDLTTQGYDDARAATLYSQLFERLKTLPAIKSVSLAEVAPFSGRRETRVDIEGRGSSLSAGANVVSADYFLTLGVPVRRGRAFTEDDARSGQSPAVISQTMANRFWPDADPIGQRFMDVDGPSHEVIGVVADISSMQVGRLDGPLFYTPVSSGKLTGLSFVLRTNGNPNATIGAIREVATSLDKDASISAEPLEGNVRRMLEPVRTSAWFSGTVSLLALLIAATGIYGMLSYLVVERTSEIGIRMALGAQRRNVLLLIVRDGMKLAAIGTVIGLAAAIALAQVMSSLLVGVGPTDFFTFVIVSLGALAVAFLACYIPARRATKVDPLVALRNE